MTVPTKNYAFVFMKIQNISLSTWEIPTRITVFVGTKIRTILKANRAALSSFVQESCSLNIRILVSEVHFLLIRKTAGVVILIELT